MVARGRFLLFLHFARGCVHAHMHAALTQVFLFFKCATKKIVCANFEDISNSKRTIYKQ